jgi:hypothetical protein
MEFVLFGLLGLFSIISLICWIMVLIKMFQNQGALHGILGIICGLYAFIWGWMNAKRYGLSNIMIGWTAVFCPIVGAANDDPDGDAIIVNPALKGERRNRVPLRKWVWE